jgi:hypothetical protein
MRMADVRSRSEKMALGNTNVPVCWVVYDPIVLAAGETAGWNFRCVHFNEARYVGFDATPDNVGARPAVVFSTFRSYRRPPRDQCVGR